MTPPVLGGTVTGVLIETTLAVLGTVTVGAAVRRSLRDHRQLQESARWALALADLADRLTKAERPGQVSDALARFAGALGAVAGEVWVPPGPASRLPQAPGLTTAEGATSSVCVPSCDEDGVVTAGIVVGWSGRRRFTDHEMSLLTSAATLCGQVLTRIRLELARQRKADMLDRLQEAVTAIAAAATQEEVLRVITDQGLLATDACAGSVSSRTAIGRYDVLGSAELAPHTITSWRTYPDDPTIPLPDAVRRQVPVLLHDWDQARVEYPQVATLLRDSGNQAWAAVPFPPSSPLPGGIFLHFATPQPFDPPQVAVLATLAEVSAQALARADAYAGEQRARRRAELVTQVSAELERPELRSDRRGELLAELLVPELADHATLEWTGRPAGARDVAAVSGQGSSLVVPLRARGQVIATLRLGRDEARPNFTPDDLALAQDIADRAALSVDNALLYEREHQVALDLQNAMLPPGTVSVPGTQLAVRYRAAEAHLQIGGDWYDSVLLPDGRIAIAIGDVVGHSLQAATAMGQLRSAVNALAGTVSGPAELLERIEIFAERIPAAQMSTLCYAELDPHTGSLRYARAGHLPPLLHCPGEPPTYLHGALSPPLCTGTGPRRPETTVRLTSGSTLLFYTDGLVERRTEPIDQGLSRLAEALTARAHLAPEPLSDLLLQDLLGDTPPLDDVAVVCLSFRRGQDLMLPEPRLLTAGSAAHP